jgi:hypothetical protein
MAEKDRPGWRKKAGRKTIEESLKGLLAASTKYYEHVKKTIQNRCRNEPELR